MSVHEFERRRAAYGDALGHHLASLPVLHVLTELPGDVDARLTARGTTDLLDARATPYETVPVLDIDATSRVSGTLVVPGSGALHPRGNEWLPATLERATAVFDRVEILASSFDTTVPSVSAVVARPTVYCHARDAVSYHAVAPYGRAVLVPDVAVFDRAFDAVASATTVDEDRARVLLVLRGDAHSALGAHGLQPDAVRNNDVGAHAAGLDDVLGTIEAADLVVTDRLHVALASTLRGRQVRYLDPVGSTITGTFAVSFRHLFDESVVRVEPAWLLERGYACPVAS